MDRKQQIAKAVEIIEQVLRNSYDYPALKIIQNLEDAGFIKLTETQTEQLTKPRRKISEIFVEMDKISRNDGCNCVSNRSPMFCPVHGPIGGKDER